MGFIHWFKKDERLATTGENTNEMYKARNQIIQFSFHFSCSFEGERGCPKEGVQKRVSKRGCPKEGVKRGCQKEGVEKRVSKRGCQKECVKRSDRKQIYLADGCGFPAILINPLFTLIIL